MTAKGWMVGALVAGGVVFAMRGCLSSPPPDQRLADQLESICGIARDNIRTPERGVRKLGGYLSKHTGEMLGELGETFEVIETIADDTKHDKRAEVARNRLRAPLRACEADFMDFADAVENNPEAVQLVEHFSIRLNRTLEIFLSGARFDLRSLPARIDHAIDTLR